MSNFALQSILMKKRYIYALLFGIPGFFLSVAISSILFGVFLGILWIYVFGDDPWPSPTENILGALLVFTSLTVWIGSITIGYKLGKRLENDPTLNQKHILIATGLTVMLITLIILQQWRVGNLGPKSETLICSDFCVQKGYSGSGMPPKDSGDRRCRCYDNLRNEALQVPLDSINPDASE
jgi:hypothetical protein